MIAKNGEPNFRIHPKTSMWKVELSDMVEFWLESVIDRLRLGVCTVRLVRFDRFFKLNQNILGFKPNYTKLKKYGLIQYELRFEL